MALGDGSLVPNSTRGRSFGDGEVDKMSLEEYRAELDKVDKVLEENFVRRMQIVAKIGEYKRQNGIPTLDAGREAKVLEKHTKDIAPEFVPYMEEYFKAMMAISRKYQDDNR